MGDLVALWGLVVPHISQAPEGLSQPPEEKQIVFSNRLDLYQKSTDSGERQYTSMA